MKELKIVVLCGGTSTERDVSLNSGKMIYKALKGIGHRAVLADVYMGIPGGDEAVSDDIFSNERDWGEHIQAISRENPDISLIKNADRQGAMGYFGPGILKLCLMSDMVFMALHGADGENGKVQATFDLLGVRYSGSDPMGSALSMDKIISKKLFLYDRVPTAKLYSYGMDGLDVEGLEYPCVIKICHGGSSVGVYICHSRQEAESAIEKAGEFHDELMAEQYIKGREFSVGVLMGEALPVIEIAPVSGFYDYENKYQPGATIETCPADIPDEVRERMQREAEHVYRLLKVRDYGRVDFMMDEAGEIYALEMNTLPGMTATSLLPQEAGAVGISFPQLCARIVECTMTGSSRA